MAAFIKYTPIGVGGGSGGGGGVNIFPSFAAFPPPGSFPDGTLVKDAGAHILYEYNASTNTYQPIASNPAYEAAINPPFPGGVSGDIQYNNGGVFGGDPSFTTDGAGHIALVALTASGAISGSNLTVGGHALLDLTIANNLSDVASKPAAFNNISPLTTTGDLIYEVSPGVAGRLGIGAAANVLTVVGGIPAWAPPATSGTVTSVSVVSANGLAGTVATATTTPAITLSTTLTTPVIAGSGTALIAATTTGTGSTVVLNASPTITGTLAGANETLSGTLVATGAISGSNLTAGGHASADIPEAVVTATGDILYASGASIVTRLGIGGVGNVLTVAAGIPSWAPPATSGTVTSVGLSAPALFTVGGSPVTSAGVLSLTYSGSALPILNGGTGATTAPTAFNNLAPLTTTGDMIYELTAGVAARLPIGGAGNVLTVVGGIPAWAILPAGGTVTSVSVVSANGFSGTVATSTTTPAITLSTSLTTPVLAGNGTALIAATTTGTGSTVVLNASPTITGTLAGASETLSGTLVATGAISGSNLTAGGHALLDLAIANNLSDVASKSISFNNISPMTTAGDITYELSAGTAARLPIGAAGNVLTVVAGLPAWAAPASSGTVTSVGLAAPALFTVSGSPVVGAGVLTLSYSGSALPILNGGTGATTAPTAFNNLSPLTTAGDIIYELSAGTAARLPIGGTGNVLTVVAGLPAWAAPASSGTVTSVSVVSANNVTGTVATPTTTPAITLAPTSASPAGSSFASWDTNQNLFANNHINAQLITPMTGLTSTLVVGSAQEQIFTGTTSNQIVQLPAVSTLSLNQSFTIINDSTSTGLLTVRSSGGNTLQVMAPQTALTAWVIATTGTGTASWLWQYSTLSPSTLGLVNPTVSRVTASGTGNTGGFAGSSTTYTTPAGVQFLLVRMVGGGGGAGGSGTTTTGGSGGTGGTASFGTSLLTATGGAGGLGASLGAGGNAGGTATVNSPAIALVALSGAAGLGGVFYAAGGSTSQGPGPGGAVSPLGGAGYSSTTGAGGAAISNTGSGGGTSSVSSANVWSGASGAAGGYLEAIIPSPSATYSWAFGAAGTAGTAGTSGFAGGAGGSSFIEVTEYYTAVSVGTSVAVSANLILMGPASGSAATPTFRAATANDVSSVAGYDTATPTTGTTVSATANKPGLLLTPAGTLATLTIKLPPTPLDGQEYWIGSSQTITAVTYQDAGGTAGNVIGGLASLATSGVRFVYSLGNTKWYSIG